MTDYRALCAELLQGLDENRHPEVRYPGHLRIIMDRARTALAHPAPPAEGEVATIAARLKELSRAVTKERWQEFSMRVPAEPLRDADLVMDRAADLLQHHPAPVPVSERLPEPNTKVLAHYFNALGNGRTVCAIWVPAKSRDYDFYFADDDFTEYDEEDHKYYWPEGWYEAIENWGEYGWIKICEGEVVYWQPLPKWPAHDLPLPAGEVGVCQQTNRGSESPLSEFADGGMPLG